MYELGKREPDFETLETIADYFNVDSIVNSVNDEIDLFNEEGGYEVEPVSMDLLNRKNTVVQNIQYWKV